jgi:DNA excision repair protein ERCC-2
MFPSFKALGEGLGEKIFYLTARTVTRQVAEKAAVLMRDKGLVIKSITLTSKEKICPNAEGECSPEGCSYARGHYDRINEAILDILNNETVITRDLLSGYAEKHRVCPFEYSLDVSLWLDLIICDYNYVFDPRAYLRRFFEYGGDYILLVDEAHNLVDRSREMFSAELDKRPFMELRQQMKTAAPGVYRAMMNINKYFIELRKSFEEKNGTQLIDPPRQLYNLVDDFIREMDPCLSGSRGIKLSAELLELYFNCLSFSAVFKLYDERYVTYVVRESSEVHLKLFCTDPSYLLGKACSKVRSSVFFSATLLPLNYFRDILGGTSEDYTMRLSSPFDRNNLCLAVADNVSTKYKDREESCVLVADYIKAAVSRKTGNYFVFFPSFEYMKKVYALYSELWPEDRIILQGGAMKEDERDHFLAMFEEAPETTLIAFAVMGGIFSEGIDLAGERLSGAVVVGVGLPQVCAERDIISRYFREKNGMGFEYAYMFPGMNKVLQAAGRVIRTESDRGLVLLLDERFLQRRYLELFPPEWAGYLRVSSAEAAENEIARFWK